MRVPGIEFRSSRLPASVINTWAIIVDLVMTPYNCHLIQSEITFKGIFDKGLCRLGWLWACLWGKRHLDYVKWDLKTRQLWVTPFLGILSWRRRVEIGGSVLGCRYSLIASCSWLWIWDELLLQIPASLTSLQVWTTAWDSEPIQPFLTEAVFAKAFSQNNRKQN